jgi:hypothetical protein
MGSDQPKEGAKKEPYWLVYIALLLAGVLFLSDAFHYRALQLWTARLGLALVYSAFALIIGNGRTPGFLAAAIVWLGVIALLFL